MIKFFRQIRFKLMETGKTTRYFKYAIGEIILVVIGILIALQINNWNQNRVNSNKEKLLLSELNKEFKGLAYDDQDEIARKGFLHRTYTLDAKQIAETNETDYGHLMPYLIPYKTIDWVQFRFHTDVYNSFKEDDDI